MDQQHIIGDRFELGELIGWGGMGEVFRGRDIQTDQLVAIKSLRDEVVAQDPHMVERFEREGQALQQLNHLNIVKVISTITVGRKHYIVMEYVPGGSLADLINTQPQPPLARVYAIARDLANALDCAHRQQIFHRDIKPSNVLLAQDGTPRLSDFGIAHISGLATLTQTGAMLGTYPYLSPEACHGATPDERTDIWAFGVLLFELVAGRRPFEGGSPAVLSAILHQPVPDLMQLCPNIPAALSSLIHRMLEKDRDKRIASAQLVTQELEQLVLDSARDSIPSTPDAPTVALPAAPKPAAATIHDSSSGVLFDSQSPSANTLSVGDNLVSLKRATNAIQQAAAIKSVREPTKDDEQQPLTIAGSQFEHASELSDLDFLRRLANEKRRRFKIRQLQVAKLGFFAEPAFVIEIEDLASELHDLERQIAEIEKSQTKRADGSVREHQPLYVLKRRRIDAALPGHAEVGQHVDLLVQIRFPNSPPLSSKDWPTKQKPTSVEQLSESVSLRFELNRETETVESIYLEIQIVAPDFAIKGASRRRLEVPPGDYSRRAAFLLMPTKPGVQRVNVEVYTIDNLYLGSIPVETTVGSIPAASTTNIANLLFQVTVEPEHRALLAPPAVQQRSDLIMTHIQAGNVPKALELIEQTLKQQPADREATMWLAQLIESPTAGLKQRLRAARLAARYDDARPGVCGLPPAMAALADTTWEIARYPITCAQFQCFIEEGGYNPQQLWWRGDGQQWLRAVKVTEPEFWHDERFGQSHPNHPVVGVSWFEAEAFCIWLSQSRRYNADGFVYRLPSETEWQHAAQDGERRDYPWGTELPNAERANFDKQHGSTTPVGCFVPGATPTSQIYDLAGNVYEWSSSLYQRKSAAQPSPLATKIAPAEWSVRVCGGSWRSGHALLRIYNRYSYSPDYSSTSLGFRVVRSAATETEPS